MKKSHLTSETMLSIVKHGTDEHISKLLDHHELDHETKRWIARHGTNEQRQILKDKFNFTDFPRA